MASRLIFIERVGSWSAVYLSALATVRDISHLNSDTIEVPGTAWKHRILRAEHSPIRELSFRAYIEAPCFVSTHLVRHKHGVEHFVQTQREDRAKGQVKLPTRATLTRHLLHFNAQAAINISRKRLCEKASPETQEAWRRVLDGLRDLEEDELVTACVPECVYRGYCPEGDKCCGYFGTPSFQEARKNYLAPFAKKC